MTGEIDTDGNPAAAENSEPATEQPGDEKKSELSKPEAEDTADRTDSGDSE